MIQQRQLLQCTITQALFRVVFISQSHTWLMPTDLKSKAWPHSVLSIDLHANVDEGRFVACKDGASVAPSVKASDHAQKTYDLFKGALDNTFALLTSNGRRDALAALRSAGKSATKKAFYKVVRRWLIGGCVVPALCATWVGKSPKLSTDGVPQMSYEGAVTQVRAQSARLMTEGYVPPVLKDHTKSGRPRQRAMPERPTSPLRH